MIGDSRLFDKYDLSERLDERHRKAITAAREVSQDNIESNNLNELTEHFTSRYYVEPISLKVDEMSMSHRNEVRIIEKRDYGMTYEEPHNILVVKLSMPYDGSSFLWECSPGNHPMQYASGWVDFRGDESINGYLYFEVSVETKKGGENKEAIQKKIDDRIKLINGYITPINSQVIQFNSCLSETVQELLGKQIEWLKLNVFVIESLNIPLRCDPRAPVMNPLPLRRVPLPLQTQAQGKRIPEYGIREEDYENILKIIRHEGRTQEQNPRTFIKLEEEELRDLHLSHLNGHYLGLATGETFRGAGKTDIRIEFENRSAFIAECKIWHGTKELHNALDQLSSYTTWRDCKCALVIYNKSVKGFTRLTGQMIENLHSYSNIVGNPSVFDQGEWKMTIKHNDDEDRYIKVHVLLFNFYSVGGHV